MAGTTPLMIGGEVSCIDGACGKVSRVVVDAAVAVTHLVVDRQYQGRLVPLGLVDAVAGGIRLRCTIAEFENLEPADKTVLPQGSFEDPRWGRDVLGLSAPVCRPRLSPTRPFPSERWPCAAASTSMPPTATSGKSGGS